MGLTKFIKTNKEQLRKIFGKKEIDVMLKQLNGENLTQNEKNVLSKNIRKKLEVIKGLSDFKDEFKLEKNQDNKRIIEKALNTILNDQLKEKTCAVFLFGSHANNTQTKRSDIDICVLFDNITLKEATKFRIRISSELPKKVDIQVFNILPMKIKKGIIKNNRILFKKEEHDNINFSTRYLKDNDYLIRMKNIFGAEA